MGKPTSKAARRAQACRARAEAARQAQRRRWIRLSGGVAGVVAVVAVGWGVVAANTGSDGPPATATVTADEPVLGDPSAPVTIVEYGDFKCPFCARFFAETEPQLLSEYIDAGKVRFVWRDFPNIDAESRTAAAAARCAGHQDRFWQYHDALYDFIWNNFYGQGINVEGQSAYEGHYVELARQAGGLDAAAFRSCLDSGDGLQAVDESRDRGVAEGVSGTPTFFINGEKVVGAQPFEVFAQLIDQELASP